VDQLALGRAAALKIAQVVYGQLAAAAGAPE
jgi:hypothetical protein